MPQTPKNLSALVAVLVLSAAAQVEAQTTCAVTDTAVTAASPTTAATLAADCTALLAIKDTLRGTASLNWATTVNMANWDGITLSTSSDNVALILLPNRSLNGSIPDLSDLTSLVELSLSNNELSGTIPDSAH